ncbi:hypothetical protein BHM03_00030755 [Ensete ventricosum]|nr:hypothetical protein BHM03_00030755 [Ensete ventricosum]
MRQRGWQMMLSTEKGGALMVAAIDDGWYDWGDDKMVHLLMEEKAVGCSGRGEGGGSVQRRLVTRVTGMIDNSVRGICSFVGEERKMMVDGWEEKRLWKGVALLRNEQQQRRMQGKQLLLRLEPSAVMVVAEGRRNRGG